MTPAQLDMLLAPLPDDFYVPINVARELREMALLLDRDIRPGQKQLGEKLRQLAEVAAEREEQIKERIEEAREEAREDAVDFDRLDETQRAELFAELLGEVVEGRVELDFEEPDPADPRAQRRIARRVKWLCQLYERLTGDKAVPHVCAASAMDRGATEQLVGKLEELLKSYVWPVTSTYGKPVLLDSSGRPYVSTGVRWSAGTAAALFKAIGEQIGEAIKLAKGNP